MVRSLTHWTHPKQSEEWKVLSEKKDHSKAVSFRLTTNYWNTQTGIVCDTYNCGYLKGASNIHFTLIQGTTGTTRNASLTLSPSPPQWYTHTHRHGVAYKNRYWTLTSKHLQHVPWAGSGRHVSGAMVPYTPQVWLPSFWKIREDHTLDERPSWTTAWGLV